MNDNTQAIVNVLLAYIEGAECGLRGLKAHAYAACHGLETPAARALLRCIAQYLRDQADGLTKGLPED